MYYYSTNISYTKFWYTIRIVPKWKQIIEKKSTTEENIHTTKIIILQFIQETKKQHPSFAILEEEGYFACVWKSS